MWAIKHLPTGDYVTNSLEITDSLSDAMKFESAEAASVWLHDRTHETTDENEEPLFDFVQVNA